MTTHPLPPRVVARVALPGPPTPAPVAHEGEDVGAAKLSDGAIYSSYKVPSIVAWYNNNLLVGEGASQLKFKLRQGKNLWHSFKMEFGEDVGCKYPNSELGKNHENLTILNPIDVSKTACFLLTEGSNGITGQIIVQDNGLVSLSY